MSIENSSEIKNLKGLAKSNPAEYIKLVDIPKMQECIDWITTKKSRPSSASKDPIEKKLASYIDKLFAKISESKEDKEERYYPLYVNAAIRKRNKIRSIPEALEVYLTLECLYFVTSESNKIIKTMTEGIKYIQYNKVKPESTLPLYRNIQSIFKNDHNGKTMQIRINQTPEGKLILEELEKLWNNTPTEFQKNRS